MEKQQKGRVIITSARNIMALVIARNLGSKGIEVIAADYISFTMLAYSKYVTHHEEYTSYEENEKQFHPERLFGKRVFRRLFRIFIETAGRKLNKPLKD